MRFYPRVAAAAAGFLAASAYGTALALLRRDPSEVPVEVARMVARLMTGPLGFEVKVENERLLYAHQPCVYLCNHQSMYDVPVLGHLYPDRTIVVGKQELRWIPFFGWLFRRTGNVWINRADTESAVHRLRDAERAIRERNVSVWIFPEGTRGREPGRLLPFKKGAFHMAVNAGVPLVPVVVSPIAPIFDGRRRHIQRGTVRVRVLDAVSTEGVGEDDIEELIALVRGRMQATLTELARETPG